MKTTTVSSTAIRWGFPRNATVSAVEHADWSAPPSMPKRSFASPANRSISRSVSGASTFRVQVKRAGSIAVSGSAGTSRHELLPLNRLNFNLDASPFHGRRVANKKRETQSNAFPARAFQLKGRSALLEHLFHFFQHRAAVDAVSLEGV